MATDKSIVEYILEQAQEAGKLHVKKMFGEYGLYCDDKIVAFICDDQLFIKPTEAGRSYLKTVKEGYPYPGAKAYFLISGELWDNSAWFSELIRVTADDLPPPKAKIRKTKG